MRTTTVLCCPTMGSSDISGGNGENKPTLSGMMDWITSLHCIATCIVVLCSVYVAWSERDGNLVSGGTVAQTSFKALACVSPFSFFLSIPCFIMWGEMDAFGINSDSCYLAIMVWPFLECALGVCMVFIACVITCIYEAV